MFVHRIVWLTFEDHTYQGGENVAT